MELSTTIQTQLASLPRKPGCYIFRSADGEVLYVGKAKTLRSRVRSYFHTGAHNTNPAKASMVKQIADIETIVVATEMEALILESTLIKKYEPRYNVLLKDDKNYLFIKVTVQEDYPQVLTVRRVTKDGARYFGPFTSARAVRETLKLLQRIFPYRTCDLDLLEGQILDKQYRPCLRYHMGRCDAPCVEKVTTKDYRLVIDQVILFLEGKLDTVSTQLNKEMRHAAQTQQFEKAARLRDQLARIKHLQSKQVVLSAKFTNQDVVGFVTDRKKQHAFASLLMIREGKVIGQEHFVLKIDPSSTDEEIVRSLVMQHYEQATFFPKELVLPTQLADVDTVTDWLTKRMREQHLTHTLHIRQGKTGAKKRLVAMAEENALEFRARKTREWNGKTLATNTALKQLGDALHLEGPPERVEIYDISNIQGTSAVGSMVVFTQGQADKSAYRRFKIATLKEQPNDVGMMREVLRRRLQRLDADGSKWPRPDLIIVDGGKPQLGAALDVLRELDVDVPLAALAKKEELLFTPERSTPIVLPRGGSALHLVQRMRDEAHRFAITFHRQLRSKRTRRSILDDVVGLGPKRKKLLMDRYGTVAALSEATESELAKIIPKETVKRLLEQLR